ncbi:acetyl-CoA synthetase-like protein [Colletotrichum eremochloae]|nr:acetyl-CoA synthetase-like protein [Colletotrichum eremochloae]
MACVMSLSEADRAAIATACNVPLGAVEDVYSCTPAQASMIDGARDEVLHFVLSFRSATVAHQFCTALRKAVSLNGVLRSRLVKCPGLGIVQAVLREDHVTERRAGSSHDVEQYTQHGQINDRDDGNGPFGLPLFRSALIGQSLVVTMHHAIMDYSSITMLLNVDLPAICLGNEPIRRPAFREFVKHCLEVDEAAAKAFWKARFKGIPAIFPPPRSPRSRQRRPSDIAGKGERKMPMKAIGDKSIPPSHVPFFIEAAWALTASIYTNSSSVAYGYVLSGRSPTPTGVEATLGPTITEVPVQVNIPRRTTTVGALIKDRAASVRQLQQNASLLHFGLDRIRALSDAAEYASGFQTLFNIRPSLPAGGTDDQDAAVKFERLTWLGGFYPLQLVFAILDDGVMVWPRSDSAVISDGQLARLLHQFEHTLRLLTEASSDTKLDNLPLLDPYGRAELCLWNKGDLLGFAEEKCLHELFSDQARARPNALAVDATDGTATYQTLDHISNCFALEMKRRHVTAGTPVGLLFKPSFWATVATLGVLKAGGTCVPIDMDGTREGRLDMARRTGINLVLASIAAEPQTAGLARHVWIIGPKSVAELSERLHQRSTMTSIPGPGDLAFVLSTGDSSGAPKAVGFEHRSLAAALTAQASRLGWGPECRTLQQSRLASGESLVEMFGTLLHGGCICPAAPSDDEKDVAASINAARANCAILPPGFLYAISPTQVPELRSLLCIGGPLDTDTCAVWSESLRLFVGWGASEASVVNTIIEMLPDAPALQARGVVGRPVGCAVWLVNPHNPDQLSPLGGVGELVVQGPGVCRSYIEKESKPPLKTKSSWSLFSPQTPPWASSVSPTRFFSDKTRAPTPPARFFRTGDLARYDAETGSLVLLGRATNCVRLASGITAQMEEVEGSLRLCAAVDDVVVAPKIVAGRTQLVAVVCLAGSPPASALPGGRSKVLTDWARSAHDGWAQQRLEVARTQAQAVLPPYHVPDLWFAVQRMPKSRGCNVDRLAVREWLRTVRG